MPGVNKSFSSLQLSVFQSNLLMIITYICVALCYHDIILQVTSDSYLLDPLIFLCATLKAGPDIYYTWLCPGHSV